MMLGDMLAAARGSADGIERWLAEAEPALSARLARAAAAEGMTARSFVRMAVADFNRFAGEDDWATLVSRLRDDTDPGNTCLVVMLEWRLAVAAGQCACRSVPTEGSG